MGGCGCDQSGSAYFCNHHLQDAFDALEAAKQRYPNVLGALGFDDSLLYAVVELIADPDAPARMGIPPIEAYQTIFIDGLMMGVLLAARAPTNHAAHAINHPGGAQ